MRPGPPRGRALTGLGVRKPSNGDRLGSLGSLGKTRDKDILSRVLLASRKASGMPIPMLERNGRAGYADTIVGSPAGRDFMPVKGACVRVSGASDW